MPVNGTHVVRSKKVAQVCRDRREPVTVHRQQHARHRNKELYVIHPVAAHLYCNATPWLCWRAVDDPRHYIPGPGVFTLLNVFCTLRRISPRSCSVSAQDETGNPFVSSKASAFSAYSRASSFSPFRR
jgi:hypothetical protein